MQMEIIVAGSINATHALTYVTLTLCYYYKARHMTHSQRNAQAQTCSRRTRALAYLKTMWICKHRADICKCLCSNLSKQTRHSITKQSMCVSVWHEESCHCCCFDECTGNTRKITTWLVLTDMYMLLKQFNTSLHPSESACLTQVDAS